MNITPQLEGIVNLGRYSDEDKGRVLEFLQTQDGLDRQLIANQLLAAAGGAVGTKRYRFSGELDSKVKDCADAVFSRCFEGNPGDFYTTIQQCHVRDVTLVHYPQWKRICCIEVPRFAASLFGNPGLQLVLIAIFLYQLGLNYWKAYKVIVRVTNEAIPFLINNAPRMMRLVNKAMRQIEWMYNYRLMLLISFIGIRALFRRMPSQRLNAVAQWINPWIFCPCPSSIWHHIVLGVVGHLTFVMHRCSELQQIFSRRALKGQEGQALVIRINAHAIWNRLMIQRGVISRPTGAY